MTSRPPGTRFVGRGKQFCSKSCRTTAANIQSGNPQQLQEGNREFWKRVKRERRRGLIGLRKVLKRTYSEGVPRSMPTIIGAVRKGRLKRERDLEFDKPWLFTKASVAEYIAWLRTASDGRLHRGTQASSRLDLIEDLHGREARIKANGRLEVPLAAAKGKKAGRPPIELGELVEGEIRRRRRNGESLREIEMHLRGDE